MKTLEQTKRAISVGFINAAWVVIVAAATLFCGVTAARADEPDNRIDWWWGRPGVMVVTNAPTAVTVTNIATTVATDVAGGVAENLFGPRVTALEGGTNNWDTAFGWGDHAGLYKNVLWFPSWTEVTGKPDLFDYNYDSLTNKPATFPPSAHTHPYTDITDPPWLTSFTETDVIALSRITVLEGKTNNWNTAYGWGNHAGLYRSIDWAPSWGDITDIPQDFPPSTHEHDYTTITNPPWLTEYIETDEIALSRITVLEGKTNNWNTAYSWGDHAGLYRVIGWVPSWADVTGKPDLFDWSYDSLTNKPATFPPDAHAHPYTDITDPPWLTEYVETDAIALAALYGTNALLSAAVDQKLDSSATNGWETGSHAAFLTGEADPVALAALAAHSAYWPPNATASSWFTYTTNNGAITITGYNIAGGTAVIIPDYINGWPVTEIGANAFVESGVTSIGGAGNVVTVGDHAFGYCGSLASVSLPQVQTLGYSAFDSCTSLTSVSLPQVQTVGVSAFYYCTSLTSVSLPQVQTVGNDAFYYCTLLASVSLPQVQTIGDSAFSFCGGLTSPYFNGNAPTIGDEIFIGTTPNQVTNYVTNPTATGWGENLGGMPVVRLDLHGDKIYQAGELVATTGHVAQAIAAMPEPDLSDRPTFAQMAATNALPYTAWTGTITPADGTATVTIAHGNMPVLVIDAPTVLQLDATGFGTSGVSRVSLSYYTGTNSLTFATNVISYADTPTVDTNGWNSLLIRRISNGTWKGVGL